MGILKDKLNKLIGKKNPINSIPAVLGDLLGDIVDSVENTNSDYDLFFDKLPNITKLNSKDIFEPILIIFCGLTNLSRDEIIKELEKNNGVFDENLPIEDRLVFMFILMMYTSTGREVNITFNLKINKFDNISGSDKVFNEIVHIKNSYINISNKGNALYAYIPEFDIYIGIVMPNTGFTLYLIHNLINDKGSLLNLDLNYGDDIDETVICNFNSFLYAMGVKYYYKLNNDYFRYVNSNYFYELNSQQFYSLDLKTWELTHTTWKPFLNL